jgi:hypothetical protein
VSRLQPLPFSKISDSFSGFKNRTFQPLKNRKNNISLQTEAIKQHPGISRNRQWILVHSTDENVLSKSKYKEKKID